MSKSQDEVSSFASCRHLRTMSAQRFQLFIPAASSRPSSKVTNTVCIKCYPGSETVLTVDRETVIPVQPERSHASEQDTAEERTEAAQPERQSSGETNIWTNSDSFQPAGILNKQATKGAFSLQNILSTQQSSKFRRTQPPSNLPVDDPVEMGLINPHVAASIFDG
jgi:hypothetical protein